MGRERRADLVYSDQDIAMARSLATLAVGEIEEPEAERVLAELPVYLQAAVEVVRRRDRRDHPAGRFDGGGRWYPAAEEAASCCRAIRSPSRSYPYSLLVHARSTEHVATRRNLDPAGVRAAVRLIRPRRRAARPDGIYYKAVIRGDDGRFHSLHEASLVYELGQTYRQRVRRGHGGGYYVRSSAASALEAGIEYLRANGRGAEAARLAVLEVQASGQYTSYPCTCDACAWAEATGRSRYADHVKLAFSTIRPVRVVEVELPARSARRAS